MAEQKKSVNNTKRTIKESDKTTKNTISAKNKSTKNTISVSNTDKKIITNAKNKGIKEAVNAGSKGEKSAVSSSDKNSKNVISLNNKDIKNTIKASNKNTKNVTNASNKVKKDTTNEGDKISKKRDTQASENSCALSSIKNDLANNKAKLKSVQPVTKCEGRLVKDREDAFNADLKYEYINASYPKVLLVSAWSYILFFLPFLCYRENKFARFHANQGLLVLLFSLLAYVVSIGLYFVWIPLGIIFIPVTFLCSLLYIILGIINASDGRVEPLPVIGKITIIKSI